MKPIFHKKLRSTFEVLESWEAGVVLTGAEAKSIKGGHMDLNGSYVTLEHGQLWLKNAHISPYQKPNQPGYDPNRERRLLMRKSEIQSLMGKLQQKGLTLVPEKVYSKSGLIKIQVALVRGLKKHDKRELIKKRDQNRQIRESLKRSVR